MITVNRHEAIVAQVKKHNDSVWEYGCRLHMYPSETRLCMSKDLEIGLMKVYHKLWRTGTVTRRVHFQLLSSHIAVTNLSLLHPVRCI
jgi:hypothetical protein